MSFLRRRSDDPPVHQLAGTAALAWADRKDAKRRRPAATLDDYAAARGLRSHGSATVPGFEAAMPNDPVLQFNALEGTLGGGLHGILYHYVLPWELDAGGDLKGAAFYCTNYTARRKLFQPSDLIGLVPVVGDWLTPTGDPVGSWHVGIPATVAAARVPDLATIPPFQIDTRDRGWGTVGNHIRLKDRGLKRFHYISPDALEPAFVERLLGPATISALQPVADRPWVDLSLRDGMLRLVTNGFVAEPAALDQLVATLGAVAAAIRAAAAQRTTAMA